MGVTFKIQYSCDPKKSAVQFCKMNYQSLHHLDTLNDAISGCGICAWHDKVCDVKAGGAGHDGPLDMMVIGFPCAPFSTLRSNKLRRLGISPTLLSTSHTFVLDMSYTHICGGTAAWLFCDPCLCGRSYGWDRCYDWRLLSLRPHCPCRSSTRCSGQAMH